MFTLKFKNVYKLFVLDRNNWLIDWFGFMALQSLYVN